MKGFDILIVRLLPFILFVITGANSLFAINGIDITVTYKLHSHSALYALALFLISLSNKKYHCLWNRAMYIYLILQPTCNFLDGVFDFIPTKEGAIIIAHMLWIITAIITAYLAIKHFINASKRRLNNGR